MEGNSLEDILSEEELKALFELMDDNAWYILGKINKKVQEDWIEETANVDWSNKDDNEMIRKLRHRQGQIKGVSMLLRYLEKKKKEYQKKSEQ